MDVDPPPTLLTPGARELGWRVRWWPVGPGARAYHTVLQRVVDGFILEAAIYSRQGLRLLHWSAQR